MTERSRKRLMYAVLIVTVIWGLWSYPVSDSGRVSDSLHETPVASAQKLADSILKTTPSKHATPSPQTGLTTFTDIGWRTDPFAGHPQPRPSGRSRSTDMYDPGFRLSGISAIGDQRMAIINGKLAAPQSTVEGWTVARIDPQAVVLTRGDQKQTLKLNGES
jgi:hypothetical protein